MPKYYPGLRDILPDRRPKYYRGLRDILPDRRPKYYRGLRDILPGCLIVPVICQNITQVILQYQISLQKLTRSIIIVYKMLLIAR